MTKRKFDDSICIVCGENYERKSSYNVTCSDKCLILHRVSMESDENSCWIWPYEKTGETVKFSGNSDYARRSSYRAYIAEIPKESGIVASCGQENCVNPAHLKLVSKIDREGLPRKYRSSSCNHCGKDHTRTLTRRNCCSPECFIKTQITIKEGIDPCWVWTSTITSKNPEKAVLITYDDLTEIAYRFSYKTFKGDIPENMEICHTCDNPPCVNPNHLKLGTHLDNFNDMIFKGRHKASIGSDNGSAKLNEITAMQAFKSTDDLEIIAKQYNVSKSAIYDLKTGRTWWHLTGMPRFRNPYKIVTKSPLDDKP